MTKVVWLLVKKVRNKRRRDKVRVRPKRVGGPKNHHLLRTQWPVQEQYNNKKAAKKSNILQQLVPDLQNNYGGSFLIHSIPGNQRRKPESDYYTPSTLHSCFNHSISKETEESTWNTKQVA
ncbi:hypothetical protein E2542_SST23162 [Spatholobus suberectus]|nr:hypothetical protein E2542_SST23162 [Spatholobus suberectus]